MKTNEISNRIIIGRQANAHGFSHSRIRLYFHSHEPNEPPHIHIDRGAESAKFSARELGEVKRLVLEHRAALLEAWDEFFGSGY